MSNTFLEDIDWNELWKQAKSERSFSAKTRDDWDKKAPSFARRNSSSMYIEKFIAMLNPQPTWSVLDVACGPGTLAIPLAKQVKTVSALDFSAVMLQILEQRALEKGLTNISTYQLSWTDDWQEHGLQTHDIVIASRAMAVEELRTALEKLNNFAKKQVVVTDKVGHGPFDPKAFAAVGRELKTGPDYIYTINILHQMGINASVDFIELERSIPCDSLEEAMDLYAWMFNDLTEGEKKRLKKYVQSITTSADDGTYSVQRENIPTWAFIRWTPST